MLRDSTQAVQVGWDSRWDRTVQDCVQDSAMLSLQILRPEKRLNDNMDLMKY